MKKSRAELKVEMVKLAEEKIEELLSWSEGKEKPTLGELEQEVLRVRKELSEGLSEAIIGHQEAVRPVPGPSCADCGQEMMYKDMKPKTVTSWVGELRLERAYYHCSSCKKGLFPPG